MRARQRNKSRTAVVIGSGQIAPIASYALGLACALLLASPAKAQELPANLGAMIREARADERKTIINVAKRMYPLSIADINNLVEQIQKDEKVAVAKTDFVKGFAGEVELG